MSDIEYDSIDYSEPAKLIADNLIRCARCNEMKECLSIATGFAGEHEPLCADCISAERLEEEDGDVIGK